MSESTYHQIHFAWADPTLLGRVGPGPAASSLSESDQPVLRSWRDRLVPALTADYASALPDSDPADYPETLWSHTYPDRQAALVYRWPGDVRQAHAWAIVGPAFGLTLPRVLALHENPNTRPAARRPPTPGWDTMPVLDTPAPWERTAAPGAVRTRDRRAAETSVNGEPVLIGAVAAALDHPDLPIHIALAPERADLWQAVQLRFLWGMHRILHDVLTPARAIPAAGWSWSFSTYDPVLGTADGQHLAFGPPQGGAAEPFLNPPPAEYRKVAEGLVAVLREEGGDALAAHLAERGVPEAPTFADRRDILCDWFDPRARQSPPDPDGVPVPEDLPEADPVEAGATEEPEEPATPGEAPAPDGASAPGDAAVPATYARARAGAHPSFRPRIFDAPEPNRPTREAPQSSADSAAAETHGEPEHGRPADAPYGEPPEGREEQAEPAGAAEGSAATDPAPEQGHGAKAEPTPEPLPESPVVPEPHTRTPAEAPPLPVVKEAAPDYAAETEPGEPLAGEDQQDNWPTQYVDLPLSRLERWHSRRGPEGARLDVVDARAAIRAERTELNRVRAERDHYHTEVQDLRRDVARLDRPWLDSEDTAAPADEDSPRRPGRVLRILLLAVLVLLLVVGLLETGTRMEAGPLEALSRIPLLGWWPF